MPRDFNNYLRLTLINNGIKIFSISLKKPSRWLVNCQFYLIIIDYEEIYESIETLCFKSMNVIQKKLSHFIRVTKLRCPA